MSLYTFIMEYRGGTYISQVEEVSPESACLLWAQTLDVTPIFNLGVKGKEKLLKEIKNNSPVSVSNVFNTWFISANIFGKIAYINFVLTVK